MPILKVKRNGVWEEVAGTSGHTHDMNDIINFPTNLPSDVLELRNLIGDTPVATQIEDAISFKADINHVHDNILQLFDTISGVSPLVISNVVPNCELDIVLTSEVYSDFSSITVSIVETDEYIFNTSVANSNGIVTGLNSFSNFRLSASSTDSTIDVSKIKINCTYPIHLNQLLTNEVIHADKIVVDNTLSKVGAAADAKTTGDTISNINNKINTLSNVAFSGSYNDLINKPDIVDSNITVSDTYDETSSNAMSGKAVAEALGTIDARQAQADWNQTDDTAIDYIKNKPIIPEVYTHPETHPASMITGLSNVALSGSYNDLIDKPETSGMIENVQADWNETDATSYAYIKNKPNIPEMYVHPETHQASMITGLGAVAVTNSYDSLFGTPIGKRTVLPLGDYRFTIDNSDGKYYCTVAIDEIPDVGTTCTVVWGEETFTTTVRQSDNWTREIGNSALFSSDGENTGEPFFVAFGNNVKISYAIATTAGTIRCHIYVTDEVKKLDAAYLPDGIATEQFVLDTVAANSGSGSSSNTETVEMEILEPQDFTTVFLDTAGCFLMDVQAPAEALIVGQDYIVKYDGTDYNCICFDASAMGSGTAGLGNGTPLGLPGNGEPFAVSYIAGQAEITVFCFMDTQPTEHTISIYHRVEKPVTATPTLPEFDLATMGLPEIPVDGTMVQCACDTTDLMAALECSAVKIKMNCLGTQVSGVLTAMKMNGAYQCGYVVVLDNLPCLLSLVVGESIVIAQVMILATLQ